MTKAAQAFRIIRARRQHLDALVPLFDAYRQFYHQPRELERARVYLSDRLAKGESVIFLARAGRGTEAPAVGFTQLYPSFSSLSMRRIWILSDLYVAAEARKQGVAKALMEAARQLALKTGAETLVLETATDNYPAQSLYEQLGYARDVAFYRYALQV